MKKFIPFPLWKIEKIEKYLEEMEQDGYRLEKIKYSHFFYFKKSESKQMRYFISLKSFRGISMGSYDYSLLSTHNANPVESKMCSYTMYRTRDSEEDLWLLYAARLEHIRIKLLGSALAMLLLTAILLAVAFSAIITQSSYTVLLALSPIILACAFLAGYYSCGYLKQKRKCKDYERTKLKSVHEKNS